MEDDVSAGEELVSGEIVNTICFLVGRISNKNIAASAR